jgi:hypothetical protein
LENIEIDLLGMGTNEQSRQSVPEAIDKYPEVKTFGPLLPAYGVWARHVKGLELINVVFTLDSNDHRPAIICEDGKDITISKWKTPATNGAEAIVRLENVDGAVINNNLIEGEAASFVRIEGDQSRNVRITKNKLPRIKKEVIMAAGAKENAATAAK